MNKNKGFTLIELLVVIAIIGILASVVLAALGSARTKAKDASATTSMNQARAGAELAYSSAGSTYKFLCKVGMVTGGAGFTGTIVPAPGTSDNNKEFASSLINAQTAVGSSTTAGATGYVTCGSDDTNGTAYAVSIKLNTGYYCLDSSGYAGTSKPTAATSTPWTCS